MKTQVLIFEQLFLLLLYERINIYSMYNLSNICKLFPFSFLFRMCETSRGIMQD